MLAMYHDPSPLRPQQAPSFTATHEIWLLIRPHRSVLLLGLLLMILNRACGLVLPASTKYLIDSVIGKRNFELLYPLAATLIAATVLQGLTSFAVTQTVSKTSEKVIADLRCQVQAHVGRLPVSFYDANKSGALVNRIMSDVDGVRNLIGAGSVDFIGGLLTSVFAFALLIHISPLLTGIGFLFLLVYALGIRRAFRFVRPCFRERARIQAEVTGRLAESLAGIRVVKAYHAESREHEAFRSGVGRLLQNAFRTLRAISVISLVSSSLMGVVGAVIMLVGAQQILTGKLTLGGFFAYIVFLGYIAALLMQVVGVGTQLTEAIAGLERTREVLNEPTETEDRNRTIPMGEVQGEVVFENVDFAYDHEHTVLHDVSFHALPGTITAMVGASGSGKSTIISLIAAFHRPTRGRIIVDKVDLSKVCLGFYRTQLGIVLQDSFLFDGTIRENVMFSKPGATAPEILRACAIAHVDEFAERFERKYDTIIGERGVKLSGGQRQRVSIARAILANPRILILDEATSNLDSESEAMIQEGLSYLMNTRTTFVIAHRLSTTRCADQILVVEGGRIVERGRHEALLDLRGRYHQLYTKQHGIEQNLFLPAGEDDKPREIFRDKPATEATEWRGEYSGSIQNDGFFSTTR